MLGHEVKRAAWPTGSELKLRHQSKLIVGTARLHSLDEYSPMASSHRVQQGWLAASRNNKVVLGAGGELWRAGWHA